MPRTRRLDPFAWTVLLAAAYFATAKMGLSLALVHTNATAVWPPTGISFAALLLLGYRVWPGILIGAFLANLTTRCGDPSVAACIAVGNTLEAVVGVVLVHRFARGVDVFQRPQDVFRFALLAGLLSPVLSTSIGVLSLTLGGCAARSEAYWIALTWWLGDAMGKILVGPALVLWLRGPRLQWTRACFLESVLLVALALLFQQVVFGPLYGIGVHGYHLAFLCIPLLAWMALRFSPRETAIGALFFNVLALYGNHHGYGAFAREEPKIAVLLLQAYMGTIAMTALALAAAITERHKVLQSLRKNEELLRHSQKMEAIGRLAAGVAHDFNNLLSAILGFSEMALDETPETDTRREPMDQIQKAALRGARLTRQLLAFGRGQLLHPTVLRLNEIVEGLQEMLRRLIGDHIQLVLRMTAESGHVKVDRGQLEQVLMNLAINARDAMPGGGRLILETYVQKIDEPTETEPDSVPAGWWMVLEIRDNGTGIDPEVLPHVFEPFFSTKEQGKGTGLGLSTAYGIIRQSHGHMLVESRLGVGSSFKIHFPRVTEAPVETEPEPVVSAPSQGHQTILVVEDEEAVRKLMVRILRLRGYQVLEAADGTEAMAVCLQQGPRLDLLLTDMMMPGMTGLQLAQQAVRFHPGLKILFVSGQVESSIEPDALHSLHCAFLAKPMHASELAAKVKELLDALASPPSTSVNPSLPETPPDREAENSAKPQKTGSDECPLQR